MDDLLAELKAMSPLIRSRALVGLYLDAWATMEWALNEAIEKAFRLAPLEGVILTKNTQFRDKIHILKTIVDLRIVDLDRAAALKKILSTIGNLAPERNMVAHDTFGVSEDCDGVRFYVMRAKGTLSFPETSWSIKTVLEKSDELHEFADAIDLISEEIPSSTLFDQLERMEKQNKSGEPVSLNALYPQPQGLRDSHTLPATPRTEDETPPENGG